MIQRLFPFALVLLVLAVFFPSFKADFVQYDDPAFITNNGYVNQGVTGRGVRWAFTQENLGAIVQHEGIGNVWHPLTWISHMIDVEIWGLERAGGHHAVNVVLHVLAVVLLYFCLLRLKIEPAVAALVSALFAVHPMHVESVAWVSERKDVLSGVFFFGTVLAYLHSKKWLSVGLFLLALMSKPSVVVLPGVLMMLDWWRAGLKVEVGFSEFIKLLIAQVKEKLPWIVPGGVVVGITLLAQYGGSHQDFVTPLSQRLLLMPAGLLFYFWRTVWPVNLSFHYPIPEGGLMLFSGAALLVLVFLGTVWILRKRFPHLLFGVVWFLLVWLPMSGIFYVGTSFTADRYTYLAHVGLFLGVISCFKSVTLRVGLSVVFLAACTVLAHQQVKIWHNSDTLFGHSMNTQPRDTIGLQNYAGLYQQRKNYEVSRDLYLMVLEQKPQDYKALYNIGNCYRELGDEKLAKEAYEDALVSPWCLIPSMFPR